jgi:site-specific DNA-methyltransferase (adenine-specific)
MTTFYKGDCVEKMRKLPSESIQFIYFNPPFAITHQPWDDALPWEQVFAECFRILKPQGTLAIHCSVPFNYTLIRAAPCAPNYSWYWDKMATTTPLLAKRQPLRQMEEILVWMKGQGKYNPQRVGTEVRQIMRRGHTRYVYEETLQPQEKQTVVGRYQTHLIQMKRTIRGFATRPDELIELFIKSYTDAGDTILDPTCYEGLSGVIAKRLGRKWIGIDKYFMPKLLMIGETAAVGGAGTDIGPVIDLD